MSDIKFSLLMSVYIDDDIEAFSCAMESILKSTIIPDDVCIVLDGPIGEDKEDIIRKFALLLPINQIRLPKNVGLGRALSSGLIFCKHEWIARFDSDDICALNRFEDQLKYIINHPDVDIFGAWVGEFDDNISHVHAIKKTPVNHMEIISYSKCRNPFNHMAVMYKKSAVLAAGGYQDDYLYEDYALWVRMIKNGCVTANIPEVLVYARTGNGMEIRRGGGKYAKSEIKAQFGFYKMGFLSIAELVRNLVIRVPIRLLPGSVRKLVYRKTLRR